MKDGYLFIILSIIVLFFFACTRRKNDDMTHLVKEWEKKEIIFPNNLYFTLYGKDTVQYPAHLQYTILSYVDSAGCFSCKLQLPMWREFIHRLDSTYPGKVSVLLFLHSKSEIELLYALKKNGFDYPVCIDENDKLNRLNHFPSDMAFQNFLLDKDNKVLAMGNPILNPKIKELYLKIIRGNDIVSTAGKGITQTKVHIDVSFLHLGNFDWPEEQKATFILKNVGDKPLVIQDVATSCGCTTVAYSKEPALPGKEIALEVVYIAEHPEHFVKTITVYCNAENSPLVLKISGDAK